MKLILLINVGARMKKLSLQMENESFSFARIEGIIAHYEVVITAHR